MLESLGRPVPGEGDLGPDQVDGRRSGCALAAGRTRPESLRGGAVGEGGVEIALDQVQPGPGQPRLGIGRRGRHLVVEGREALLVGRVRRGGSDRQQRQDDGDEEPGSSHGAFRRSTGRR